MTPLQFAKEQCANFAADGSCKGIGIRNDGSLFSFGAKPACVLRDRKARCLYFEECVLPAGIEPCNARNIQREKERQEALSLYADSGNAEARKSGRLCPQCRKREVEPPKRFCYDCAEKRKRGATLESNRRRRHDGKTAPQTPVNIGPNEGQKNESALP